MPDITARFPTAFPAELLLVVLTVALSARSAGRERVLAGVILLGLTRRVTIYIVTT